MPLVLENLSLVVKNIVFIKAGTTARLQKKKKSGLLFEAENWTVLSDFSSSYAFPHFIAATRLRPDIVIFSRNYKRVIIIELTCPCEENMEEWHNIKLSKYAALVNKIEGKRWCVDLFAVEVGARGYCSHSLTHCLKHLGFTMKSANKVAKTVRYIS